VDEDDKHNDGVDNDKQRKLCGGGEVGGFSSINRTARESAPNAESNPRYIYSQFSKLAVVYSN
jgi:hypothetical protein